MPHYVSQARAHDITALLVIFYNTNLILANKKAMPLILSLTILKIYYIT